MANPEHVEILKQGVETWNRWREENPHLRPDLRNAYIYDSNLDGYKLLKTDFNGANLSHAKLNNTNLYYSNLIGVDLSNASLNKAFCIAANFARSNLTEADFSNAIIKESIITNSNLYRAKFFKTVLGWTTFGGVDLSTVEGLETVIHDPGRPSYVDLHTYLNSKGKIPAAFIMGIGIPIQAVESLSGKATCPSCFISYSSKDSEIAQMLRDRLYNSGVRCWFAPEDMKIGDKIRDKIDQSIRLHDKLLLVLSEHSINSDWVEDEAEAAYEQERNRGKPVLFPIRLDNAVMDTDKAWAAKLRRSRHIGDFTKWKDHDAYQKAFDRLLRDLKAE